jgi:hypothetical protein
MKFQYFRFFVNKINVLFESENSKSQIIKDELCKNIIFEHRKQQIGIICKRIEDEYIFYVIGKRRDTSINLSPQEEFKKETVEDWKTIKMFLTLSDDKDKGQTIAIEINENIFSSDLEFLRAWADMINKNLFSTGYSIAINPITEIIDFWDLVDKYRSEITEVDFTFNTPNLFKLKSELNKELEDAKINFGANEVGIRLKSNKNMILDKNNDFLNQSVEYTSKGGGEYKLTVRRKKISSKQKTKTKNTEILDVNLESSNKDLFKSICGDIFK